MRLEDYVKHPGLYFKSNELLSWGFNSRDEGGADTIISLLWKYYSGCSVDSRLATPQTCHIPS